MLQFHIQMSQLSDGRRLGLARLVRLSGQRLLLTSSVCWRAFCDLWQMTSHFEHVSETGMTPLCFAYFSCLFFAVFLIPEHSDL